VNSQQELKTESDLTASKTKVDGSNENSNNKELIQVTENAAPIDLQKTDSIIAKQDSSVLKKSLLTQHKADPEEKEPRQRKLALYFTAMPTMGYQRVETNKNDNIIIESVNKVSNFSSKRLGIRAELGAEYPISNRVKIFGGILYYQRKQTIEYIEKVNTGNSVNNVTDDGFNLAPEFRHESKSFNYELKNIGVQIGLNYVLSEKKFLHVAGTGIEFHKALNKLPEDDQLAGFTQNPSTYVFYNFYYRVQYPAQGKLKAIFQPTFNYSLYLNKDMNAPFYVKPYGLGLNLGLTYNF
jgi:hypothetical protein